MIKIPYMMRKKLPINEKAPFFELATSLGYVALLWPLQNPHTISIVGWAQDQSSHPINNCTSHIF